jgi:hypothetical protein
MLASIYLVMAIDPLALPALAFVAPATTNSLGTLRRESTGRFRMSLQTLITYPVKIASTPKQRYTFIASLITTLAWQTKK